jgi:integrase
MPDAAPAHDPKQQAFFPLVGGDVPPAGANQVSPAPGRRGRPRGSSGKRPRQAPGKPYPSFPLTPHASGQFCKKIRGKVHYFGSVADPDAALKRYHQHCEALHSGKATRVERTTELTVADLANRFLAAKDERRELGELSPAAFVEYHRDCERFVGFFGRERAVLSITREDLADLRKHLAKGVNAVTLSNRIGAVRSILKYAYDEELIDRPVRFGVELKRPEQRLIRRCRAQAGRRHFLAAEIRGMLKHARPVTKAMILLGINCGLGNTDVANLPASCVDLERGWLDYARGKTGVERRCPLWPETVVAINEFRAADAASRMKSGATRVESAEGLLFATRGGLPQVREEYVPTKAGRPTIVRHDALASSIQRLMAKADIRVRGLGFYGLRNALETIGAETGNQVAVDHIMGHAPHSSDMGAVYRRHVAEKALRQVTDHVHDWLFTEEGLAEATSASGAQK